MLKVEKTDQFVSDLEGIVLHVAQDNLIAAADLEHHIHDQVDRLKDPNFSRRRGRKTGTLELVAHPNYVVVIMQTKTAVTALAIMHVARQYP